MELQPQKPFHWLLFLKRNLGLTIKTNTLREMIIFHAINRKMPNKHKRFPSRTCQKEQVRFEIDVQRELVCKGFQDILLCSSYKISCKINYNPLCENPCLYCYSKAPNRESILLEVGHLLDPGCSIPK